MVRAKFCCNTTSMGICAMTFDLQFWMDSFHIWHKSSQAREGVSSAVTFKVSLYLQSYWAMNLKQILLKYCTSLCVCFKTSAVFSYLSDIITSIRGYFQIWWLKALQGIYSEHRRSRQLDFFKIWLASLQQHCPAKFKKYKSLILDSVALRFGLNDLFLFFPPMRQRTFHQLAMFISRLFHNNILFHIANPYILLSQPTINHARLSTVAIVPVNMHIISEIFMPKNLLLSSL